MCKSDCKSTVFCLDEPQVMGILNITPDSFYDGGKYQGEEAWIAQTAKMLEEGADIIDIGAMSTRPGAQMITEEEEANRLIPAIKILKKTFPDTLFSMDTFRSSIARATVGYGADIINDIYGGTADDQMAATIAELKVPYILMHIKGDPDNMQDNPIDSGILTKVMNDLKQQVKIFEKAGAGEHLILDPGFGFGKTVESNYELLRRMPELQELGYPLLVGVSRKSMINKILDTKPEEALNGTTALNMLALHNGASILRVHDVKEAVEVVKLYKAYKG